MDLTNARQVFASRSQHNWSVAKALLEAVRALFRGRSTAPSPADSRQIPTPSPTSQRQPNQELHDRRVSSVVVEGGSIPPNPAVQGKSPAEKRGPAAATQVVIDREVLTEAAKLIIGSQGREPGTIAKQFYHLLAQDGLNNDYAQTLIKKLEINYGAVVSDDAITELRQGAKDYFRDYCIGSLGYRAIEQLERESRAAPQKSVSERLEEMLASDNLDDLLREKCARAIAEDDITLDDPLMAGTKVYLHKYLIGMEVVHQLESESQGGSQQDVIGRIKELRRSANLDDILREKCSKAAVKHNIPLDDQLINMTRAYLYGRVATLQALDS